MKRKKRSKFVRRSGTMRPPERKPAPLSPLQAMRKYVMDKRRLEMGIEESRKILASYESDVSRLEREIRVREKQIAEIRATLLPMQRSQVESMEKALEHYRDPRKLQMLKLRVQLTTAERELRELDQTVSHLTLHDFEED